MNPLYRGSVLFSLFAMVAIAADSPDVSGDLVHRANRAFEQGEFGLADQLYAQAAQRTDDPGLVAFNRGVLHFQREQFREAELNFRRALEDSVIPDDRRGKAWYNLGNALVRQAGSESVAQLRSAISCYENALDALPEGDALRDDAVYNLELAKLLWARANAERPQPNTPNEEPPENTPPPRKEEKEPGQDDDGDKDGHSKEKERQAKALEKKGTEVPKESDEKKKSPGAGRLPVLPDNSVVQRQSPEDTQANLKRIEDRLRQERLNLRREAAAGGGDRDW
jgi:tetratricopeptide (TPR) repeat protein